MELHGNARLAPYTRELICRRVDEEGWTAKEAADAAGCSERTVYRWLARWRAGEPMTDRSSAPHVVANRTPDKLVARIEELRRLRWTSTRIAAALRMAVSTVCAVLKRIGLHRLSRLEPLEPPNRYCRRHPGELIHIDVKKLGRIVDGPGHRVHGDRARQRRVTVEGKRTTGWEFVHVCVDDHSRLAYAEVLADEKAATAVGFLARAIAFYASHGITVQRLMTDNGPAYRSDAHAIACRQLRIRHLTTQPYRPRTNGKAERFIQTLTRRWAYGRSYASSAQRTAALPIWLEHYNFTRPHGSLSHKPPGSRLTNLPRNNS